MNGPLLVSLLPPEQVYDAVFVPGPILFFALLLLIGILFFSLAVRRTNTSDRRGA